MNEQPISSAPRADDSYCGFAAEQLSLLLTRARTTGAAPKAFTGCVSEISSCEQLDHSYADALKQYGAVYEAAQAYLAPGQAVAHDYDACAQGEQDTQGAQVAAQLELLLQEEQEHEQHKVASVSDDEVERCGYLGWLRH